MTCGGIRSGVTVLVVLLATCAPAWPCEPPCPSRAEFQHRLALAEEHRGWVEFWIDLDDPEARAELGFFAHEMRQAAEVLSAALLVEGRQWEVQRSRVAVEWAWYERKRRQLSTTGASVTGVVRRGGR
ncbi:hypothetical protein [Alsobacter sp. R-9]